MPRIRSAATAAAAQQPAFNAHQATDAFGSLALADAGCSSSNAAEAAADGFADGRTFRAYGHDNRVFDLAFHPASSSLLISASDDCSAGVWRRQQGGTAAGGRYMQVAAFQGHADSVMRVAWSPDGSMLASGSSDGVVCLWRPLEAALTSKHNLGHAGTCELARLEGHPEECYACVWLQPTSGSNGSSGSSDGIGSTGGSSAAQQRLVTASGESLYLWDVATQQQLCVAGPPPPPAGAAGTEHSVPERWRPGYLFGVKAQADGPLIGAACSDGRLRLWAREGGDSALSPLCTLPWNQAMGSDCVFGRSGLFCAVSKDGSVIMMDVRQGRCLHHLQVDAPLMSCTLLGEQGSGSGGGQCLVAAGADGGVHFVDCTSGEVTSLFPEAAPPRPLLCACLSADGASLAASGEAVVLGEDDLASSEQPGRPAGGGHQPLRKWSPIHIWQRQSTVPP